MSILSECCDAPPWGDMAEYGICSECKEHCEFRDDEDEDDREFSEEQLAVINRIQNENREERH